VKWYLENFADELYIDRDNLIDYNFVDDPEFLSALSSQFTHSLTKFVSDFRCKPDRTILAKDCKRDEIWRKLIYSNYKSGRDKEKKPNQPNLKPVFGYVYDILLPKLVDKYGFKLIGVKYAEGDDIIAVITEHVYNTTSQQMVVMANDMDLCQIINDRIEIHDYSGNSINEKCFEKYGSPKRMLVAKILQGDRADDIPNICKGMGPKTAMKCIENKELLMEKLEKFPEASKQLKLNKRLVDFQFIPEKLKNAILRAYEDKFG
jgi:5'-3' exonuclease